MVDFQSILDGVSGFFADYVNTWQGYVTLACMALLLALVLFRFVWKNGYAVLTSKINAVLSRIPWIKNLKWQTRIMFLTIALAIFVLTPFNPITKAWIWEWELGSTYRPPVDPLTGDHTTLRSQGVDLTATNFFFKVVNGWLDDGSASSGVAAIHCYVLTGTPSAMLSDKYDAMYNNGELTWKQFLTVNTLTIYEDITGASNT